MPILNSLSVDMKCLDSLKFTFETAPGARSESLKGYSIRQLWGLVVKSALEVALEAIFVDATYLQL